MAKLSRVRWVIQGKRSLLELLLMDFPSLQTTKHLWHCGLDITSPTIILVDVKDHQTTFWFLG